MAIITDNVTWHNVTNTHRLFQVRRANILSGNVTLGGNILFSTAYSRNATGCVRKVLSDRRCGDYFNYSPETGECSCVALHGRNRDCDNALILKEGWSDTGVFGQGGRSNVYYIGPIEPWQVTALWVLFLNLVMGCTCAACGDKSSRPCRNYWDTLDRRTNRVTYTCEQTVLGRCCLLFLRVPLMILCIILAWCGIACTICSAIYWIVLLCYLAFDHDGDGWRRLSGIPRTYPLPESANLRGRDGYSPSWLVLCAVIIVVILAVGVAHFYDYHDMAKACSNWIGRCSELLQRTPAEDLHQEAGCIESGVAAESNDMSHGSSMQRKTAVQCSKCGGQGHRFTKVHVDHVIKSKCDRCQGTGKMVSQFQKGAGVEAEWKGRWHDATILAINGDGTFDVRWTKERTKSKCIPLERVRKVRCTDTLARPDNSTSYYNEPPLPQAISPNTCVVCQFRATRYAVLPCGHLCLCEECQDHMSSCPICRGEAKNIVRIWVS